MTNKKITELTAWTPVDTDIIPFVDISDTTQSPEWTTKKALKSTLQGADGKTVLNWTIDPTIEWVDGDFYINTTSWQIFWPKSWTWGTWTDLIWADGADGADWVVQAVVWWTNVTIDNTDPANPIVNVGASWHIIEDEWTPLTTRESLNFIWSAVTVTDNSWTNASDVTIDALTSDPSWVTWADKITNIMSLTQAEYDAITTPDANTQYTIIDWTPPAANADALNSATTVVDVSTATAPTVWQVLTATWDSAATWQDAWWGWGWMELITTTTLSWISQVDFTSASIAWYDSYMIKWYVEDSLWNYYLRLQVSNNNLATVDAMSWAMHRFYVWGSTAQIVQVSSNTDARINQSAFLWTWVLFEATFWPTTQNFQWYSKSSYTDNWYHWAWFAHTAFQRTSWTWNSIRISPSKWVMSSGWISLYWIIN